jgi:hypothetical protein
LITLASLKSSVAGQSSTRGRPNRESSPHPAPVLAGFDDALRIRRHARSAAEFKATAAPKSKPIPGPHNVYGFLTTELNAVVKQTRSQTKHIIGAGMWWFAIQSSSCSLSWLQTFQGGLPMKIAFVVAAAVLTTVPLVTLAKAQGVKMAQVDMQTGLHLDDPDYRNRRRYDPNATVGVGPGGVTIGPRQRCRMETTTIKRVDGRRITRREHVCN